MKLYPYAYLSTALALSLGSPALATDQTIDGNLSVTGDIDLGGNTLSLGTRSDSSITPGINWIHTDGASPSIHLDATRGTADWLWTGAGKTQFQIGSDNKLSLFDQATPPTAQIILDPAGTSLFSASVTVLGDLGATSLTVTGPLSLDGGAISTDGSGNLSIGGAALINNSEGKFFDSNGNANSANYAQSAQSAAQASYLSAYDLWFGPMDPDFPNRWYTTNIVQIGAITITPDTGPDGGLITNGGTTIAGNSLTTSSIHANIIYDYTSETPLASFDVSGWALHGNISVVDDGDGASMTVEGNAQVSGTVTAAKIRVPPSGDLSMGEFTNHPGLPSL